MRFIIGLIAGVIIGRVVSTPLPDSVNEKIAEGVDNVGAYMSGLASDMKSGLNSDESGKQ